LVGYPQDINYEMACLLVTEIITLFENKIARHPDYKVHVAKLRFAHGETVVPIVATLVCLFLLVNSRVFSYFLSFFLFFSFFPFFLSLENMFLLLNFSLLRVLTF
jgi:hypothetical protein